MHLDETARFHATGLLERLMPPVARDRWRRVLLEGNLKGWKKLDPAVFWVSDIPNVLKAEPKGEHGMEFLSRNLSAEEKQAIAVAFYIGHSEPAVRSAAFSALAADNFSYERGSMLDGIVSIVPGKTAVALSHDGEFLLLRYSAR